VSEAEGRGEGGRAPGTAFVERRVEVSGGRTLVIRPVNTDDADGIVALYDGLDADDRHRRFFFAFRPSRTWIERMTKVADRGGFGLVAVVDGPAGSDVIAEASYSRLPNGDGELGITVSGDWRGWLGPYLLDALIEAAAARGVPNLEADVLVTNGPMLALARSRGCVTMDHPDWTVVRLLIGTAERMPSWPGRHERPRVLVEGTGHWPGEGAARAAGLDVLSCPGPAGRRSRCPVLDGHPCPLAAGTDAIIATNRTDDERWTALMDAHGRVHPGVPVCVEVRDGPDQAPVGDVAGFLQRVARGGDDIDALSADR